VDDQFGLNPQSNAVNAADPIRQRREACGVVGEPSEVSLDLFAKGVQRLSELLSQQLDRTQATRTVAACPNPAFGRLRSATNWQPTVNAASCSGLLS
jgi:hypothetical protein